MSNPAEPAAIKHLPTANLLDPLNPSPEPHTVPKPQGLTPQLYNGCSDIDQVTRTPLRLESSSSRSLGGKEYGTNMLTCHLSCEHG